MRDNSLHAVLEAHIRRHPRSEATWDLLPAGPYVRQPEIATPALKLRLAMTRFCGRHPEPRSGVVIVRWGYGIEEK